MHETAIHKKSLTYSFQEKPTWCTIYLQYISSNTSTCYGRIYTQSIQRTSWWWAVVTPETCRGVWRNILNIKFASSWFSLNDYIQIHGQQNIKPRSTVGHGRLNKEHFHMCNNITGIPRVVRCKLASKTHDLFYSATLLLPACGVQSLQRTERNSTTKPCLKISAKWYFIRKKILQPLIASTARLCPPDDYIHIYIYMYIYIYIYICIYVFKCALININIGREWLRTKALAQTPRQGVSSILTH